MQKKVFLECFTSTIITQKTAQLLSNKKLNNLLMQKRHKGVCHNKQN